MELRAVRETVWSEHEATMVDNECILPGKESAEYQRSRVQSTGEAESRGPGKQSAEYQGRRVQSTREAE